MSRRAVGALGLGFVLCCLMAAASPAATNDFGTRYTLSEYVGSRVAIDTPSITYAQGDDEFVLNRAAVQSGFNAAAGLAQAGVYRSGNGTHLDNCTSSGYFYFRYLETKAYGSPTYQCQVFTSAGVLLPGTVVDYEVFRHSPSGSWGIYINGVDRGTFALGFNTGSTDAGGEIADADSDRTTATATQYGPSGSTQWSAYTCVPRCGLAPVTGNTSTFTPRDAFWTVPAPPTPFTIKHRL